MKNIYQSVVNGFDISKNLKRLVFPFLSVTKVQQNSVTAKLFRENLL